MLAPIEPASTGNGLAMRAQLFRSAAQQDFGVRTLVVPVAGRVPGHGSGGRVPEHGSGSADVELIGPDQRLAAAGIAALIRDPAWRERLAKASPLPLLARAASVGLAELVASTSDAADRPAGLHVMRSYLAPLGVALAERLQPGWMTLDLDDDDAGLAAAQGDQLSADAYNRLLDTFAGRFDAVCAASPIEADELSRRHGLSVEPIPNAVELPETPRGGHQPAGEVVSLLLVGNLTYGPNAEAAQILAREIAPVLSHRLGRSVQVTLVGAHDAELKRSLGAPGVTMTGPVPDLAPFYAAADVVVVPLRQGAGTRIKLLDALAHGVPVVASSAAARGLETLDGRHLLIADDPGQAARAIEHTLDDSTATSSRVREARQLVEHRYSTRVVRRQVGDFFARAAARGEVRRDYSAVS